MAEILKLENSSFEYALEYAVHVILRGKVVAFPTDTFYGLGADPFNLAAVSEIFRIKRRTADRPVPLLVDSIDQAADLADHRPGFRPDPVESYREHRQSGIAMAHGALRRRLDRGSGASADRHERQPFGDGVLLDSG
jgi:L-threonylcarbamoyladenylate synthase